MKKFAHGATDIPMESPIKVETPILRKSQTTYYTLLGERMVSIAVNEEVGDHYSVFEYGEPCSGVLKHWGTKNQLIGELKDLINIIKELPE